MHMRKLLRTLIILVTPFSIKRVTALLETYLTHDWKHFHHYKGAWYRGIYRYVVSGCFNGFQGAQKAAFKRNLCIRIFSRIHRLDCVIPEAGPRLFGITTKTFLLHCGYCNYLVELE